MTDIHTLGGAYVLNAVDDLERTAFDQHLTGCETCTAEVAEWHEAAARLADPSWSVPPPRLRAEVLAAVSRTPQERPGRSGRSGRSGVRWRRGTAAAVAAGVLAAGAGAVTWTAQEQRVRDYRASVLALEAERDRIRAEQERITAVLTASDATVRTGTAQGGGRVTLVLSSSLNQGVVTLGGLARPGTDRAYQLWLIDGTTPAPAGVLPAGTDTATVLVTGVRGKGAVGVTEEPAGGSSQPTATPVAVISIT